MYDTDAKQSAKTRVKMLTMLAENRTRMLAYHFAWPGIGHVAKHGDGFRYFLFSRGNRADADLRAVA
jgi:hypothetical protein